MSQQDMARRTAVQVAFAGVDITSDICPYLLSTSYTDNEEDETDDLQIKLQDRDGIWLESWLGAAVDAAAVATAQNGVSAGGLSSYMVTAKSGLNVRSGAGTSYKRLGSFVCGATVQVSAFKDGWASIQYGGKEAYVCAKYIKPVGGQGATATAASSDGAVYTVVKGDTLSKIAANYGTTWKVLAEYNSLKNPNLILPGQKIKIPGAGGAGSGTSTALATGMKIQAVILRENWKSDGKDKALDCGQFELDSVEASGPPSVITIKATSLPYTSQVRQMEKTKAWEGIRLSGILQEMGKANGMTVLYESAYDPYYERVEQFKVSDIAFASQLCHDAGISLKVTNNIMVAFDQVAYEGKSVVRTIRKGDRSYTKYRMKVGSTDTKYSSCRVRYTDPGTGKLIEGIAYAEDYKADDKTNQQLEVWAKVSSVGEANTLASKRLRLHNKYDKSVSFTLPGDTDLVAGVTIMLEGWGLWDGKYIIKRAVHTVDAKGYVTQIQLRRVLEGY